MAEDNACVHCGADCGKHPVVWNNMKFCCNGCKTVYQILNENKLYKYYEIEQTPGIKIDQVDTGNQYAYLDKEEVKEKLFLFREGTTAKVRFFMPVIHCASCIWLLENLRTLNKGVKHSIVNFVKKEVTITFDEAELSLRQLVELLVSINYVPEISLENVSEEEQRKQADRKLLYKLGVAGFVFANVMTYSLPEYFGLKPYDDDLTDLFRKLSFILIVPVVLFSASDYFVSAYKNLIKRNVNIDLPIALGVLVLFVVTSFEVISDTGSGYPDSLAGLVFFLLLGKSIQNKTYQALSFERDYKSYFPVAVSKLNNSGAEESILLEEIQVGDKIQIRSKELIPADSILLSGEALIDYSFVTGEANPVKKRAGEFIYAGGRQTGGLITVQVEKEVEQSHLTKLWNDNETADHAEKDLKSITDKVSEYFTPVTVSIAVLGFIAWAIWGDMHTAIFVFTAVLIVACPCALALSLPFTFGNTMRIFGLSGLYIKNISIIEKLTHVNTIVFDKTGTITKPDENNIAFHGQQPLTPEQMQAVYALVRQSTHPLSQALANHLHSCKHIDTVHFVEMSGKGLFGRANNMDLRIGSEEFAKGEETADTKQSQSVVYVAINNELRGYFSINNQYRPGFEKVIEQLKHKFDLYLISGDNDSERHILERYFKPEHIFFNQKPQDKKDFIAALQAKGKNILMTGDGLNDSGALMQANVALSVADDVFHFSPAGDAVLEAAKFDKLADFVQFTHSALNIVKTSFAISFLYNVIGIGIALAGLLSPVVAAILMPVSSISVVAFATFVTRIVGKRKKMY